MNNKFHLLSLVGALAVAACGGGSDAGAPLPPVQTYDAFSAPEAVTITGLPANIDPQEPFISRDSVYLFFNSGGSTAANPGQPQKDLYYATRVDDLTFSFQGALSTVNDPNAVVGAPSMDGASKLYFIKTSNYDPSTGSYDTIYSGTWTGSMVAGAGPVSGLAIEQAGFVNFDVEISPDGQTMYFNDGDFRGGNSFPDKANIAIAVNVGGSFSRLPDGPSIMAAINTETFLEYAPGISADGLELFFTRLDPAQVGQINPATETWRATRETVTSAFGVPQRVSGLEGFIEGPTLSQDEKSLYFHKRDDSSGRFQIMRIRRP